MDKIEKLYNLYKSKGLITDKTSIDVFRTAKKEQITALYDLGKSKGLFQTTDADTFATAWASEEAVVEPKKATAVSTESPSDSAQEPSLSDTSDVKETNVPSSGYLPTAPPEQATQEDPLIKEHNEDISVLYDRYKNEGKIKPIQEKKIQTTLDDQKKGDRSVWEDVEAYSTGLLRTGMFVPMYNYDTEKELKEKRVQKNKVDFLSELPEEKVSELNEYAVNRTIELDRTSTNLLAENTVLDEKGKQIVKNLKHQENTIRQIVDSGKNVPAEGIEAYEALYSELEGLSLQYNANIDILESNDKDIGNFAEELDLLKKNFGGLDYYKEVARLSTADMIGGLMEFGVSTSEMAVPALGMPMIEEQTEGHAFVKQFRDEVSSQRELVRPALAVGDIESPLDFSKWLGEQTMTQLPILTVLAASGGTSGLTLLGASAGGQKMGELRDEYSNKVDEYDNKVGTINEGNYTQEEKDLALSLLKAPKPEYSPLQIYLAGAGFGMAEALSERVSLGILSKGKRTLQAIKHSGLTKTVKKGAGTHAKETVFAGLSESSSEAGNSVVQNMIDILYLGKEDVHVFDGVEDALASGFAMGVGMKLIPTVIGLGGKAIMDKTVRRKIIANTNKIEAYMTELKNNPDISDEAKAYIQKKIDAVTKETQQSIVDVLERLPEIGEDGIKRLIKLDKKANGILSLIKEVNKTNLSDEVKKDLMADYQGQIQKILAEKDLLLNPVAKVIKDKEDGAKQEAQEGKEGKGESTAKPKDVAQEKGTDEGAKGDNKTQGEVTTKPSDTRDDGSLSTDSAGDKVGASPITFEKQPKRGDDAYTIKRDGESIGDFDLRKEEGVWVIENVGLNEENKGQGLGKEAFRIANGLIPEGEGTLHSSGIFEGNSAKHVWESLVKSGEAIKIGVDAWMFADKPVKVKVDKKPKTKEPTNAARRQETLDSIEDLKDKQFENEERREEMKERVKNGETAAMSKADYKAFRDEQKDLMKEGQRLDKLIKELEDTVKVDDTTPIKKPTKVADMIEAISSISQRIIDAGGRKNNSAQKAVRKITEKFSETVALKDVVGRIPLYDVYNPVTDELVFPKGVVIKKPKKYGKADSKNPIELVQVLREGYDGTTDLDTDDIIDIYEFAKVAGIKIEGEVPDANAIIEKRLLEIDKEISDIRERFDKVDDVAEGDKMVAQFAKLMDEAEKLQFVEGKKYDYSPLEVVKKGLAKFLAKGKRKKVTNILDIVEEILPAEELNKYKDLYELAARNGIKVHATTGAMAGGVMASYAAMDNTINLSAEAIAKDYTATRNFEAFIETLNHEIIHGLVYTGVKNDYLFHTELESVYKAVLDNRHKADVSINYIIDYIEETRERFPEYDENGNRVGNLEELITYAFTNKKFARFLDSIPMEADSTGKKSVFDQLKDIIRKVIKTVAKGSTSLDRLNEIVNKHLDNSMNESIIKEGKGNNKTKISRKKLKGEKGIDLGDDITHNQLIKKVVDNLMKQGKSKKEILEAFDTKKDIMIAENYFERAQPVDQVEAYNKARESYKKAQKEMVAKKSTLSIYGRAMRSIAKKYWDRQYLPKMLLMKAGGKLIRNYMITSKGASGFAKYTWDKAYDKIYKGLSSKDISELDQIILQMRFIAIDKNLEGRGEDVITHPDFQNQKTAEATLAQTREILGDAKFEDLENRAKEYFKSFSSLLDSMYESGIVTKDFRDSFFDVNYQPRVFLQFLTDQEQEMSIIEMGAPESASLGSKQIQRLQDGSNESLITDSMYLLARAINTRAASNAMNLTNRKLADFMIKQTEVIKQLKSKDKLTRKEKKLIKYFDELASRVRVNPIVGFTKPTKANPMGNPKYKFNKKSLEKAQTYYKEGVKHQILMEESFFEQYNDNLKGLINNSNTREQISTTFGSALVKSIATGNNPAFFITNSPRDWMFIATFSEEYGSFVPLNMIQLAVDTSRAIFGDMMGKQENGRGRFEQFVKHGGMLDFLHTQGKFKGTTGTKRIINNLVDNRVKEKGRTIFNAVTFSKLQMYSEIGFRMAVFNRSVRTQTKKLGLKDVNDATKEQQEDIYTNATASARNTTDFSQGGTITKDVDALVPYLNAGVQGTRVAVENLNERFVQTSMRMAQSAVILSSAPILASIYMLGAGDEIEEEKEYTSTEKYLKALEGVSQYDRTNYQIYFTGRVIDGEREYVRVSKPHFMTPLVNYVNGVHEGIMKKNNNWNGETWGTEGKFWDTEEELGDRIRTSANRSLETLTTSKEVLDNVRFALEKNVSPIETSVAGNVARNPIIKASLTYLTGYDFYRNQDLSYLKGKVPVPVEGHESKSVEAFYKNVGEDLGLSPARMKGAVESIITTPSTSPFVGVLYGGLDVALSDKDSKDSMGDIKKSILKSVTGRFKKTTSDFNRRKDYDKLFVKEFSKVAIKNLKDKFIFKDLAKGLLNGETTNDEIEKEFSRLAGEDVFEFKRMVNTFKATLQNPNKNPIIMDLKFRTPGQRALILADIFGDKLLGESGELGKMNSELKSQLFSNKILNAETITKYEEITK